MEKRKLNRITAGFIVLVVMVLILMFSNSLRRSSHITLPEEGSSPGQAEDTNASGGDALTVIAVTPETVQTAIETLTRPRQYSRVIRVEQLWDGGSGSFETTVTVSGRWTRTDRSLSDGQVRHTITDGEITYIWYGSESSVYSAPAGDITPDDEQAIPTYETILDLPVEDIAAADYRSVSDVNCIYVETVQDPEGYTQRYWVSVETGLLVASERLLEGETIYRMASLTADLSTPSTDRFILPDGTVLRVLDVHEQAGVIWHTVDALSETAQPGAAVTGTIDWEWRFDKMQQHTGEHILSGILHQMFGAENVGFHIGSDAVRMDTSVPISAEGLREAELAANRIIWENVPVLIAYPTPEELAALTYRSKKEIAGQVRIVTIPGADVCACCGTHVRRAGEVGIIKVLSCQKFREGVRLEILCGSRAYRYLSQVYDQDRAVAQLLSVKPQDTLAAAERQAEELAAAKQRSWRISSSPSGPRP